MGNTINERIIFGLRSLIAINEKRYRHYKGAVNQYRNRYFSTLLEKQADQSHRFIHDLKQLVIASGGNITEKSHKTIFNTLWLLMKDSIKVDSVDILLSECVAMERDAIKLHKTALALSFLPLSTKIDIKRQIECFEEAITELHAVRKNSVNEFQLI